MVKKGQARGPKPGTGGSKKASAGITAGENIFEEKKPSNGTSKSVDPNAVLGEAPKKPSAKQIIGGASWTGKLPVNMLSEHCQKQKWEKPEYTMVSCPQCGRAQLTHGSPRHQKATPVWLS